MDARKPSGSSENNNRGKTIPLASTTAGTVADRRLGHDRRNAPGSTQEGETGAERRRGPGRRLSDFARAAEEGEMTKEQFMFLMAIDAFKKSNGVMYPTWTEVLEVIRLLGYRKTLRSELNITGAEDWIEASDALSGVRAKPGHPESRREAA